MSYSRWSTSLGVNLKTATSTDNNTEAFIAWMQMTAADRKEETERQGGTASKWYIYWDSASYDDLGCYGQLLAVWYAGIRQHPLIDYTELSQVVATEAWESIPGFNPNDHPLDVKNVKDCIREWLEEVEEAFPEQPTPTRLETAQKWTEKTQQHIQNSHDIRNTEDTQQSEAITEYLKAVQASARVSDKADWAERLHDPQAKTIRELANQIAETTHSARPHI